MVQLTSVLYLFFFYFAVYVEGTGGGCIVHIVYTQVKYESLSCVMLSSYSKLTIYS